MKVLVILMVLALVMAMAFADDTTPAPDEAPAAGTDDKHEKYEQEKPTYPPGFPQIKPDSAGFRCTASGGVTAFIVTSVLAMFLY